MTEKGDKVFKDGQEVKLPAKKDQRYYQIAQELVQYSAGTVYDSKTGKTLHVIYDITNHLGGMKVHPNDVIPIMVRKGYLKIDDKHPDRYLLDPEGKKEDEVILLSTDKLRKLAKRLQQKAKEEDLGDKGKIYFMTLALIKIKLSTWFYDADAVVSQMIAKGYLVEKKEVAERVDAKQKFYNIFATQKQGQNYLELAA